MESFFIGLCELHHAKYFQRCFISVNRLKRRKSDFEVNDWIMDSGGFNEISRYGEYRDNVETYAALIDRWSRCGNLLAAVAQDYIVSPPTLKKTGKTVSELQKMSVDRYNALLRVVEGRHYIMPVIHGITPEDYVEHLRMYGDRFRPGMYIGVGSLVKISAKPDIVGPILKAIRAERPDLKLHAFGVKLTGLKDQGVRDEIVTSDSMAWAFAARMEGRNSNCWKEADAYRKKVEKLL